MNLWFLRQSSLSALLVVLAVSVTAYAQEPTPTSTSTGQAPTTTTTTSGQPPTGATTQTAADGQPAPTTTTTQSPIRRTSEAYWAPIAGLERDTHGTTYMFVGPQYLHPLRDNLAVVATANLNYLRYEFAEGDGETRVGGPGVGTNVGLRFGGENWFQVGAGVGIKRRTERFFSRDERMLVENSDVRAGLNLASSVWVNPTDRTNVHGMVNYAAEDDYIWSRLGVKRQVSNFSWTGPFANFLGAEVMAQGNDDIRSLQLGGFLELAHVKSSASVMLRGGWKQSSFEFGDDKTGPYFAVGYYQRLR